MAQKFSKNAEVEALRARLAQMSRAQLVELCKRANVSGSTIQKFRKRYIADIGADKYAALTAVIPSCAEELGS